MENRGHRADRLRRRLLRHLPDRHSVYRPGLCVGGRTHSVRRHCGGPDHAGSCPGYRPGGSGGVRLRYTGGTKFYRHPHRLPLFKKRGEAAESPDHRRGSGQDSGKWGGAEQIRPVHHSSDSCEIPLRQCDHRQTGHRLGDLHRDCKRHRRQAE